MNISVAISNFLRDAFFRVFSPWGIVLFLWKERRRNRGGERNVGSSNIGLTQVDGGSEGSVDAYANGRKGANFERFYHASSTGNWGFCFDDWWNDGRLSWQRVSSVFAKWGKVSRKKKRHENNIHFSQGNRSVSNNVARISNNNF